MTREQQRRAALQERYRHLDAIGKEWDKQNPDACPECAGRPGFEDYKDEGGGEHASWCRRSK